MSARIVIEKIIRILKIKRPPLKDWNSRSIVNFAENTPLIRKQNKEKSDGWESVAGVWHPAGMFVPLPIAGKDFIIGQ